ncbi:MAG: bifunctional DNA-binding transcriptional regulator/O6-methylguanine-DNA methyltransferase Ada [Blastocatellia bacterium]|nr:bifunctional DNA-binding transcriptional regulator/O6-methylguanine-DNA methyltransferase Ada [Blastocatellia bacterium]
MTNDEQYWQALCLRDARYDGVFVYGVRTTGVFCRPTCASRQPKRENIEFFEHPEAARQAGFRACKRCRPEVAGFTKPSLETVERVRHLLETHIDETLSLDELSAAVGVSPYHLQRTFKQVMGVSPKKYAANLRLNRFKQEVRSSGDVTRSLYDAGYGSSSRLYEKSTASLGMTPSVYRRGGQGMNIAFTTTTCSLGHVLIATTERGVCAVSLGDSVKALETSLVEEFPAAKVQRDDASLTPTVAQVVAYVNGSATQVNVPLDIQATAFQQKVWAALRQIPYGSTRSYGEIAAEIGQPKAVRAVARACATNRIAVVIPCHRVVRETGELSGYRWGVQRKQTLLNQEKQAAGITPQE